MRTKLDNIGMLRRLARLKGSALRRLALGRAIVVLLLATTHSVAASEITNQPILEDKPFNVYNTMNLKLYLNNQIGDWSQMQCANELAERESSWRPNAINKDSGAYGIFQSMSEYAPTWDAFKQIDKHIEYVDTRYSGNWCKALQHLKDKGWH